MKSRYTTFAMMLAFFAGFMVCAMGSCTIHTGNTRCNHDMELVIPSENQAAAAQMYERIYTATLLAGRVNPNESAKNAVLNAYGVPMSKLEKR